MLDRLQGQHDQPGQGHGGAEGLDLAEGVLAGGGIELEELVGEIAADVETRAVGGEGEAAGDVFFAARGVGERQRHTVRGRDSAVGRNREDLEAAVDIAQDEAASVRCEYEAGVADLALGVGLENLG